MTTDLQVSAGINWQSELDEAERDIKRLGAGVGDAGKDLARASDASRELDSALGRVGDGGREAEAGLRDAADSARVLADSQGEAAEGALSLEGLLGDRLGGALSGLGTNIAGFDVSLGSVSQGLTGLVSSGGSAQGILAGLTGGAGSLASGLGTLAASINPVTLGIGAVAAGLVGLAAGFAAGLKSSLDFSAGLRQAEAQFGLTGAEAERLATVGEDVFANNWDESIGAATVRAGELRQTLGDMADDELSRVTQSSAAFEQVFSKGVEDQQRALQALVGNFDDLEGSGTRALDLLTAGFQQGLNTQDDLIDTANEYSNLFVEMGFNSSEFFGILKQGLDAGARDTDKVADLFKEFEVRIKDGSDATREALAALGIDEELSAQVARGEVAFRDAFTLVQGKLAEVDGDVRETALVGLFGTLGEDVGSIIQSLDLTNAELSAMEGQALAAGDAINRTVGSAVSSLVRSLQVSARPFVQPFVDLVQPALVNAINGIAAGVDRIRESQGFRAAAIATELFAKGLGLAFSLLGKVIGLGNKLDPTIKLLKLGAQAAEGVAGRFVKWAEATGLVEAKSEDAAGAVGGLVDEQGRATAAAEETVSVFSALNERILDGRVSTSQAVGDILALAEAGTIAEEEVALLGESLRHAADAMVSGELEQFGISIDRETIGDVEALQQAINDSLRSGNEERSQIISNLGQAEDEYHADRAATASANAQRLAEAETKAQADIAKAQESGDADRIAKAQAAAAERVAHVRTENGERLAAVEAGYQREREALKTALAQSALDTLNAQLRLGQVSEEQANIIFGSLKDAFPGAELFDPTAKAALQFNAKLGSALSGNVQDAVELGDAVRNIDAALDESQEAASDYADEAVEAYRAAREELEQTNELEVAPDLSGLGVAGKRGGGGRDCGRQPRARQRSGPQR